MSRKRIPPEADLEVFECGLRVDTNEGVATVHSLHVPVRPTPVRRVSALRPFGAYPTVILLALRGRAVSRCEVVALSDLPPAQQERIVQRVIEVNLWADSDNEHLAKVLALQSDLEG